MWALTKANEFPTVGSILHNKGKSLSSTQIQKRKFLYLEGLIRFLELYGRNEIGEVEVDIEKISLWINSPMFENVDIYSIKSIESVYKMITDDIVNKNVPLYRFLKLTPYQIKIFEKDHYETIKQSFEEDCEEYPCLKCLWYNTEHTPFGVLSECKYPHDKIGRTWRTRRGYHDITKFKDCKVCTTINNVDEFIQDKIINNENIWSDYDKRNLTRTLEKSKEKWINKVNNLDNSLIPIFIKTDDKADLKVDSNESYMDRAIRDLGRAFGGKLTYSEIRENHQKCIFLEATIKFVEIYAQINLGTNYRANISKIAEWVTKHKNCFTFQSKEEVYTFLENEILNGMDIDKFCKVYIN